MPDQRPSPWLRSPVWDSAWLLCGIWLLLLGVALDGTQAFQNFYIACMFVLWSGHRLATVYLAYSSPAYRPLLTSQRGRFLIAPLVITLSVFAFLFAPEALIPYPIASRVFFLMGCDFFFNLHHFALQHYGVLSIYRMRAGQDPASRSKVFEKAYCLWIGGVFVAVGEIFHGAFLLEEQLVTPFVAPATLAAWLGTARVVACSLIAVTTVALVAVESRSEHPSFPKTLYLLSLAILSACSFLLEFDAFIALWAIQHWIVAVGITGHMVENDARQGSAQVASAWYRLWSHPNRRFWTAVLLLAVISVLAMPVLEIESSDASERYAGVLFPWLAPILSTQPLLGICLALGFASGFVHYLMDRAIYRFSDPDTRAASLPLLMNRPR
jgi:hypothetical protein